MPLVRYEINDAIRDFFSHTRTSATREQCDDFVRSKWGEPFEPVPLQGVASYTVRVGTETIVQFREQDNYLDESMLARAKATHPDLVPSCEFHGFIGGLSSDPVDVEGANGLQIYSMNNIPGENYAFVRSTLAERFSLQLPTVQGLASFFSQCWLDGRADPLQLLDITEEYTTMFTNLADSVPARFKPHALEVQEILPMLRSGQLPIVLTHGDLNEMNILVDPSTGNVTGVVDWAEASFLPFGFALYALDNALGSKGPNGWSYFSNAAALRREFWDAFQKRVGTLSEPTIKSIQLARKAGLLIRYGTSGNEGYGKMIGAGGSSDSSLAYLDALLPH